MTQTLEAHRSLGTNPAYQAYVLLWTGFTAAPILAGLDKVLGLFTDWAAYLAPGVAAALPGSAEQIMFGVGAVEVLAGILVALRPRIGGYVVAAWLAGIIANLLLAGGFADIALRDLGLLVGALALARMAEVFPRAERTA